jgi:hypothetical protein
VTEAYRLDPVPLAGLHVVDRMVVTLEEDDGPHWYCRIRCRACRRTRLLAQPHRPSVVAADYLTSQALGTLHSSGCNCVHLTDA